MLLHFCLILFKTLYSEHVVGGRHQSCSFHARLNVIQARESEPRPGACHGLAAHPGHRCWGRHQGDAGGHGRGGPVGAAHLGARGEQETDDALQYWSSSGSSVKQWKQCRYQVRFVDVELDWRSIRSSPRYGLSTPYRLTIRKSARLFHHVLFNMPDLHLVLPELNLSILDAGIYIDIDISLGLARP